MSERLEKALRHRDDLVRQRMAVANRCTRNMSQKQISNLSHKIDKFSERIDQVDRRITLISVVDELVEI